MPYLERDVLTQHWLAGSPACNEHIAAKAVRVYETLAVQRPRVHDVPQTWQVPHLMTSGSSKYVSMLQVI